MYIIHTHNRGHIIFIGSPARWLALDVACRTLSISFPLSFSRTHFNANEIRMTFEQVRQITKMFNYVQFLKLMILCLTARHDACVFVWAFVSAACGHWSHSGCIRSFDVVHHMRPSVLIEWRCEWNSFEKRWHLCVPIFGGLKLIWGFVAHIHCGYSNWRLLLPMFFICFIWSYVDFWAMLSICDSIHENSTK